MATTSYKFPVPLPTVRQLALVQGLVHLLGGAWPVVHMRSFEAVSGRKTDKWLVRTVGLLVATAGIVLLKARAAGRVTDEIALLGVASSGSLAAIDFAYGIPGVIPRRYLFDGVMQLMLACGWLATMRGKQQSSTEGDSTSQSLAE